MAGNYGLDPSWTVAYQYPDGGVVMTNPNSAVGVYVPPGGNVVGQAQQLAAGPWQQQVAAEQAARNQGSDFFSQQGSGMAWNGSRWVPNAEYVAQNAASAGTPEWRAAQGNTPGTPGTTNPTYPAGQTSAQRAATMLYNAMRGLPFISPEFLSALQAGQAPAPRTVTPQTLAALSADETLSDAFFSVIRANALYPESYLAEIARFIPKGMSASPSFI